MIAVRYAMTAMQDLPEARPALRFPMQLRENMQTRGPLTEGVGAAIDKVAGQSIAAIATCRKACPPAASILRSHGAIQIPVGTGKLQENS